MESWTKPFGTMVAKYGRVVGRSLTLEYPTNPAFRIDTFPFRSFQPVPSSNGAKWHAPGHTIEATARYLRITESFARGEVQPPNPELDAFLRWLVDEWERRLTLSDLTLRAIEHYDYDGEFPHIFGCKGNEASWSALNALLQGTLRPENFVQNFNFM